MHKGLLTKITFVTLKGFCLFKHPPPPIFNGQYRDGWNANQNQMKNTCPFYIVFQVLQVLLIKICKYIQPPEHLLVVALCYLLHQQISLFTNF